MADGLIRAMEAGGRIGDVFGAIEGKLKEWVTDAIKHGPGEKRIRSVVKIVPARLPTSACA